MAILVFTNYSLTGQKKVKPELKNNKLFGSYKTVCKSISDIAYSNSDTFQFKKLIEKIKTSECGKVYFFKFLFTAHDNHNIKSNPIDSMLHDIEKLCDTLDYSNVINDHFLKTIASNSELIDLLADQIIYYNSADKYFKTNVSNQWFPTIYLSNLSKEIKVADIGSGTNTLAILISALYPDIQIYSTEIKPFLIEHAKKRFEIYKEIISTDHIKLILSDSSNANLDLPVDLMILNKSFHHFKFPEQMLASMKASLKRRGHIILNEPILKGNLRKNQCKKSLKKKVILKYFRKNGFKLRSQIEMKHSSYFLLKKK